MARKILISDDSQFFLISVGLLLKRMEFRVIPAKNGEELLKLAKLTEPHVIIIGDTLKTAEWIEVLRRLKEDKHTSHIPVIVVSADSGGKAMKKCKSLGCSAYLLKPVKIDELHREIQNCFYAHLGTNRKHLRAQFNKKVGVTHKGETYELFSENLSVGGIFLRKKEPFPVGSRVEMALSVKDGVTLQLKGVVIYTKELFGDIFKMPPGMAIEFRELTKENYETLKTCIEDFLADDILDSQEEIVIARDDNKHSRKSKSDC
jgi:CheY-like chemotaxis protein